MPVMAGDQIEDRYRFDALTDEVTWSGFDLVLHRAVVIRLTPVG